MPGVWVWSLVGELRSYMTQGQNPKTSKRSNIVTNYKDFKNDLSISKSLLKKSDFIWYSALKWSESWSVVSNSATHSTSMGFSRPEYWCGWPFPSPGDLPNPGLPHCRRILYQLSHQGSPRILEWVAYPFSRGSSWPRNQTRVSCIEDRFLTSWTTREALSLPWIQSVLKSIAHQWRLWLGYESLNIGKLKCQSESGHYDGTKWHQDFPLKHT